MSEPHRFKVGDKVWLHGLRNTVYTVFQQGQHAVWVRMATGEERVLDRKYVERISAVERLARLAQ